MAAVPCPYCQHALNLRADTKPGRYTPVCQLCGKKFVLTIPEDRTQIPVVAGLKSERARLEETQAATLAQSAVTPSEDPAATAAMPRTEAGATETIVEPRTGAATAPATASMRSESLGYEVAVTVGRSDMPSMLGGYKLLKELGRGGMGAVYLARQLSLNRQVALKVMKPQWASDAAFVARFTREAYAAAQLTHHNVVQIYDFGEDKGTTFFSMEFVEGQTLGALLKEKTRLDADEAVGYVLQAARGLKFAHDQSMIHRDIKPDNLLLNRDGIVKVADLGLVKTPEFAEAEAARDKAGIALLPVSSDPASQITMANVAMGTPAFMAPEQAKDAARVDARADIYSLGCTLYILVTGRPPFEGKTVVEILSKHQTEPITPPDLVAKRVPKALSEIILKMTAKKPEDRFSDLGDVIRALENYLGISTTGPFTPREEHASLLEESAAAFHASPAARLRAKLLPIGMAACGIASILCVLAGRPALAAGMIALGGLTAAVTLLIAGFRGESHLFSKLREFLFGSSLGDWLIALAGLLVVIAALVVFKLAWVAVAMGVAAVLFALAIDTTIGRRAKAERNAPLEKIDTMLRSMRLQGLDEDAVRQFVCKYTGQRWEELYEALFGYDAKREARDRWGRGAGAKPRPKFAAWRDPIVAWIEAKGKTRRELNEARTLQKIEEKGLQALGENLVTARRKARRAAQAMVTLASEIKESTRQRDNTIAVNRSIAQSLREAATKPESVLVDRENRFETPERSGNPVAFLLGLLLGPKARFLAGAALVAGCLFWMHQNAMISSDRATAIVEAAKTGDVEAIQAHAKAGVEQAKAVKETKPLELPMIPGWLTIWVSSFGAGAGGLMLIVSSLFRGWRMSLFAVPAPPR